VNTLLLLSVFLACAVESVEAATIVLAAGTTRDWRSTWTGVGAGLLLLACIVAAVGPALTAIPLGWLRLIIGSLLLVFGLQWLRKAILRASGLKALHDEESIYRTEVAAARAASGGSRFAVSDWYAFTLSFKGVLLEGLEVAFIVVTFGATQHALGWATLSAIAAVAVVVVVGAVVRAPLARVPENTMKFAVGAMLTSFGLFWSAEGAGVAWPGSDLSILGLLGSTLIVALGAVVVLRRYLAVPSAAIDVPRAAVAVEVSE
jgi:uncharacterized membrane protein